MVMPIEELTLKKIRDSIELKIKGVGADLEDLKAIVRDLKDIVECLKATSEAIKGKTDLLPNGFTRGGQYKAR